MNRIFLMLCSALIVTASLLAGCSTKKQEPLPEALATPQAGSDEEAAARNRPLTDGRVDKKDNGKG